MNGESGMNQQANYRLEIPGREDDEEDQTEKQRAFIKRLIDETGAQGFDDAVIDSLGKWQASYLIERSIEIRDGEESEKLNRTPFKSDMGVSTKVTVGVIIAIVILYLIL